MELQKLFITGCRARRGINPGQEIYLKYNQMNASYMKEWPPYDIFVVHDPQPAALIAPGKREHENWLWRCHIDTSVANEEYWDFLYQYTEQYDTVILP